MKLLPFWPTILWKSWSNRAAAMAGVLAGAAGCLHAFDVAYPSSWGNTAEYFLAAGSAFCGLFLAPTLRVISQNFGTDASGNQIVAAIGTAPAGTSPTPAVVVAMPPAADKPTAPTTTTATVQAVADKPSGG
jgi:hypothetical protein